MPRAAQRPQQLARADHRLHPVLELGDDQLVQLLDQLRRPARLAEALFEHPAGDLGRGADQLALVGGGELQPAALEQVLLGPRPDRLGVEQQPVVVEDDRVRGATAPLAGRRRPSSRAPPAPRRAPRRPRRRASARRRRRRASAPLVTIASRPPCSSVSCGQPGDRVDHQRGADADHQLGPLGQLLGLRASALSGSISPKRTTSGLTGPPQVAQTATPSSSKSASTSVDAVGGRAAACRRRSRSSRAPRPRSASRRHGAGGRCSG